MLSDCLLWDPPSNYKRFIQQRFSESLIAVIQNFKTFLEIPFHERFVYKLISQLKKS